MQDLVRRGWRPEARVLADSDGAPLEAGAWRGSRGRESRAAAPRGFRGRADVPRGLLP